MRPLIFMGSPERLDEAYPPNLRSRVQELARVIEPAIKTEEWRLHADILHDVQIILATWNMPRMDAEFLEALPNLRAVFYAAGTVKGFVTPEAFDRGLIVSSARSANAIPVAEYAASTVLLGLKRFWYLSREVRGARSWPVFPAVPGGYRSTVGLVSLGAAGRQAADILSRFDLNLLAYDPLVSPQEGASHNVSMVSLEDVFSRSDVVSIHAPWLAETENFINAPLLRLMKHGSTLINTARGAVIDEDDLCMVLRERPDLTAVLDVTNPEPPAHNSPLYNLENVIVTPHIAGSLGKEISRLGGCMVDELGRYVTGQPLKYQIEECMLSNHA